MKLFDSDKASSDELHLHFSIKILFNVFYDIPIGQKPHHIMPKTNT